MPQSTQNPVLDLTSRALRIHADSQRRGSVSPVYSACTRSLIYTLAKEIVSLSDIYKRPQSKIVFAAEKAIKALGVAMDDPIDVEVSSPSVSDAFVHTRYLQMCVEKRDCDVCGANPGEPCTEEGRAIETMHTERVSTNHF